MFTLFSAMGMISKFLLNRERKGDSSNKSLWSDA
jgi:hypothetical protein